MTGTTIRPFGERALLVEVDDPRGLAAALAGEPIAGVAASVVGRASVLVELEPSAAADAVAAALEARAANPPPPTSVGRMRTVPVIYGGEHGPDLEDVAATLGCTTTEVIDRHRATELEVLFVGFAPGFPYLGPLPDSLSVPRLATPRTRTPAGSVAIADGMGGIYPAELPGGWPVIGATPVALFDPERDPPAYLVPGDRVRWQPIRPEDWASHVGPADDW